VTVAELIAALSKLPPEAHVLVGYEGTERTAHNILARPMYATHGGGRDHVWRDCCIEPVEDADPRTISVPPGTVAVLVTED
jgi:hypothetical protein